jgi:hypothetical protein
MGFRENTDVRLIVMFSGCGSQVLEKKTKEECFRFELARGLLMCACLVLYDIDAVRANASGKPKTWGF